jgi:subtilisin-like proprotein convertase family protein
MTTTPRGTCNRTRRAVPRTAVRSLCAFLALAGVLVVVHSGGPIAPPLFGAGVSAHAETVEMQTPTFSISDVSGAEADARKTFTFTVSLSGAAPGVEHRVTYRTADGTATGPTLTRTTAAPISIPIIGTATPYPATVNVAGLGGTIEDVAVRLEGLTHTYPEDLDILLVGPGGQRAMFMSDVGGWNDVTNVALTFQDGAPPPSPTQLVTGTFSPSNFAAIESLPAPAPPGPYPTPLSAFQGTDPNGVWQVFIEDDFTTDIGTMSAISLIFSLSGTGDYIPTEGELIFPPGVTSLPVTITIKGDTAVEPTETFFVNLSSPVNAVVGDAQGTATIFNDDGPGVPTAVGDSYAVVFNTPLTVPAPGVLANDDARQGGAMTAMLVRNVEHGTLSLNPNGGFTYTATPGYAGPDSFVYRATTMNGGSNDALVTLAVSVPSSVNDAFMASGNTPLGVPAPGVLGNDNANGGGSMTAALVAPPANGTVTLNGDGSFVYVPALNFLGVDTFTYQAATARGAGSVATVSITVVPPTTIQAPTGLIVDSVVGNRVRLRFVPPLLGPPPTGYMLKGGLQPNQVLAAFPTGNAAPIFTFIAPTGSFFIRMHSLAGTAESGPSNEVPLHVNVPVTPTAPINLIGLANGSTVTLAWKNTFGGGPPTNIILSVRGALTAEIPVGLRESLSFVNVPPGTYTVRVRGAVTGSWGPSSTPVTLTFPGGCSGAPLPPSNVLAYRIGRTVHAIWDPPPAGPAPTSFRLDVTGAFTGSFSTAGRALSGAAGSGAYKLDLVAVNPCGVSAPAPSQAVTVP